MKLLILQSPVIPSHLAPNICTLITNTLSLCSSLNMTDLVSCQYKSAIKIIVLCILIFIFFSSKWKAEGSGPNGIKYFLDLVSCLFLHAASCDLFVLLPNILNSATFFKGVSVMFMLYTSKE